MKIMTLTVGLIIIFIILNMLYKRTNHYRNSISQLQKFINGVPDNLEIVNTGSSYARYAFDYSYTFLNGFNFGLQPQSLSYDFRILKQYTPNLKRGCVVLITLPNLVFGFLDYQDDHRNTKYYYFLIAKNILGHKKIRHIMRVTFPVLSGKRNFFKIIKDEPLNDLYDQDKNLMTRAQVYGEALSRVEGWKKQFSLDSTININFPDELERMFESTTGLVYEMIEYCLVHGFKPVIIVPPCSNFINDLLSKQFMKKVLYDNIQKANKRKVPVLDYLYDVRFQDCELYINSDMLNKVGRDKFTRVVVKDLKELGVIGRD